MRLRLTFRRQALLLPLALLAGITLDRVALSGLTFGMPGGSRAAFRLVEEAWQRVDASYVDRAAVNPQHLAYGAVSGMVDALGDSGHSTFLTPEMVKDEQDMTSGHFAGIGAEVEMKGGHVVVVAALDGSPAMKAGLQPGDIILKVDDRDVGDLPLPEVVRLIRGAVGTEVSLTLRNPDTDEARTVRLKRADVPLDMVSWALLPGTSVAHVRIAAFSKGTSGALAHALEAAQRAPATAIILDLRHNPGGLLDEAVGVASQLLPPGAVVLRERDAHGQVDSVAADPKARHCLLPVVVLVDGGTASAAEIVSGALQDAGRAQLVGETTFGTGTVLEEFPLSDGSALRLAVREWLTPDGKSYWHHGLDPQDVVKLAPTATILAPAEEARLSPEGLRGRGDGQLLAALELIRSAQARPAPASAL